MEFMPDGSHFVSKGKTKSPESSGISERQVRTKGAQLRISL